MGLSQKLLAIELYDIKDVEYYPRTICFWDFIDEDGNEMFNKTELAYFININILQGYFERKYDIKNYGYVQVSNKDMNYLIYICDQFLKYFSKNFIQEIQDYRDLNLYKYAKKYQSQYLDDLNKRNPDITNKIGAMFFINLNNKLKEVIKKNKGCQQIVKEELPITPGFSYGDDRMTIYYLLNILEIKENFENIKQYSLNTDKEKIYYHCWY